MKKILVTGATGFIGCALIDLLSRKGFSVYALTRNPAKARSLFSEKVVVLELSDVAQHSYDTVINLAGAGILDRPWTQARIRELFSSRIDYSQSLFKALAGCPCQPSLLLNASAIGYYGYQGDTLLGEDSTPVQDGIAQQLCEKWEQVARDSGIEKVCCLRFGVVLGAKGGALSKMLLPFKLGLGGPIGDGLQWMSWVHIDDLTEILQALIRQDFFFDTLNITSNNPIRQKDFAQALGRVLGRPTFLVTPKCFLKILFGQGAGLLTESQKVVSTRLDTVGYQFKYSEIDEALEDLLKS